MKVSSKLIILISLGIIMVGFQFGVNRYLNNEQDDHNRAVRDLNKMSESLLNAIIEEKEFATAHDDESLEDAVSYTRQAITETEDLTGYSSIVSSSDVASIKKLLEEYRRSFSLEAQYIKQLDVVESTIHNTITRFNRASGELFKKLAEQTSGPLSTDRGSEEQLRTLSELTKDVSLTINQLFLTVNEDLFRKNDMNAYLLESENAYTQLQKQQERSRALLGSMADGPYTDFNRMMIRTIEDLPPQVKQIRQIWTERDVNQGQLDSFRLLVVKAKERLMSNVEKSMARFNHQLLLINGLAFLVSVLAIFFIGMGIVRSITKPISDITASARQIAAGDLSRAGSEIAAFGESQDVAAENADKDEIRQLSAAFARMAWSLHSLIGQVQKSGIQVVSSATEISASAGQLKETANQQVVSVNQVGATSREITSRSQNLSNTMSDVASLVVETATLAEQGHGDLARLEAGMQSLEAATSSIAEKLESINEKTRGIDTIVTTITKVAAQTNLLSLNAAIEAEKAGEYGLGFSVVAREIRRLADQTAVATLDIEQMVQDMESAVHSGVTEVNQFVALFRNGVVEVERISQQLSTIINRVQALTPHFDAVSAAMRSQSAGAEEINEAMEQLSETAELTNQVIHDFKVATDQLTEAAQGLQGEVSKFRIEA